MLGPRKLRYQRLKEWLLNRVYRQGSSAKDRLFDRTTSIDNTTSSNFTVDVTDAQTIVTDVDEDTTSRQGVSVTKVKRAAIDSANNNNNRQSKEMENEGKRLASSVRNRTIRVAPLKKLPSVEEGDAIQSSSVEMDRISKQLEPEMCLSTRKINTAKSVSVTIVPKESTVPRSQSGSS